MKEKLDALKNELTRKLLESDNARVGEELHNLFGQFHARTIIRNLLRVLAEVMVIVLSLAAVLYLIEIGSAPPECVRLAFHGGIGARCMGHSQSLMILGVCALVLLAGSFVSTRLVRERRFQHSALVTVFTIFFLTYVAERGEWGWLTLAGVVVGAVLLMFAGYRLALKG